MEDPRAHARFPPPRTGTAQQWGRSPRSLTSDDSLLRLTRTLWSARPGAAVDEPRPLLRWEKAALIQRHHDPSLLVSHLSAAQLWGLPIAVASPPWTHVLLDEPPPRQRLDPALPELTSTDHRRNDATGHFFVRQGIGMPPALGPWECRTTHALETVLKCLPWLPGWRAVAAVDQLRSAGLDLTGPLRTVTAQDLRHAAEMVPPGFPGSRRLAAAIDHSSVNTWSPMETLLRLAVVGRGAPEPRMNLPVRMRGGETFRLDLAWPEARAALEYNGRVHYENRQIYGDEQHRLHLLEDAGWKVRVLVVDDLRDHHRFEAALRWLRRALS